MFWAFCFVQALFYELDHLFGLPTVRRLVGHTGSQDFSDVFYFGCTKL